MPADPSDSAANNVDSTAAAAGDTDGDDDDRSYDERVLAELVPDVSGDSDDEPSIAEGDPAVDRTEATDGELAEALDAVDDDLLDAFIKIVISIKAGILLISAGLLVIGFRGMDTVGGGLIAIGCLAFARAGQRYWAHR